MLERNLNIKQPTQYNSCLQNFVPNHTPRTYIRGILGVNRTQISQFTNKTSVEYFSEMLEKAQRKNQTKTKQTSKLKMYIAQQK